MVGESRATRCPKVGWGGGSVGASAPQPAASSTMASVGIVSSVRIVSSFRFDATPDTRGASPAVTASPNPPLAGPIGVTREPIPTARGKTECRARPDCRTRATHSSLSPNADLGAVSQRPPFLRPVPHLESAFETCYVDLCEYV